MTLAPTAAWGGEGGRKCAEGRDDPWRPSQACALQCRLGSHPVASHQLHGSWVDNSSQEEQTLCGHLPEEEQEGPVEIGMWG